MNIKRILTLDIRLEQDVVLARQRAAQIAELLDFSKQDRVRIGTAVSEIARNAYEYAGGGKAEFLITETNEYQIRVTDRGPGISNLSQILNGGYVSTSGMGLGIVGARRLMSRFEVETSGEGTTVLLGRPLPPASLIDSPRLSKISEALSRQTPKSAYDEIQRQNRELLTALDELERSRSELRQINQELEDTNRGVVALYAELDEKAEYLRRASDLKTRFLSNMTHEFRTPVNSILSLCRILLDRLDGELTAEQDKQVRFIQKAADDLSELVNDLLDLAKVEAGKVTVHPEPFEMGELFGALRGTLRPLLAQNAAIKLVFEEPEGIPTLYTDDVKVSQILRNLISNALKFTERGEVRVRAHLQGTDRVSLIVSDTGIGIPLEHQERIFEEFVQLEGAHQKKVRGTGLGLPITKKLTELLGGTISVQSQVGAGATFYVTIPVSFSGREDGSIVAGVVRGADPLRYPVLVIDEDPETLFLYEKLLKGTPFQAIPVRSIRDARSALLETHPIAVVLDVHSQNEKHWGFLHELRMNPNTQQLCLYVVSDESNRERALAVGASDFHKRPPEPSWLVSKLSGIVTDLPKPLLLIVDDDDAARYVLRGRFRETRFAVEEASNGAEGVAKAGQFRPSAILLDLTMPGLDGLEVVERLKADLVTRDIPIIIHSAKSLSEDEKQVLQRSVAAVLSKTETAGDGAMIAIRGALQKAGIIQKQM